METIGLQCKKPRGLSRGERRNLKLLSLACHRFLVRLFTGSRDGVLKGSIRSAVRRVSIDLDETPSPKTIRMSSAFVFLTHHVAEPRIDAGLLRQLRSRQLRAFRQRFENLLLRRTQSSVGSRRGFLRRGFLRGSFLG